MYSIIKKITLFQKKLTPYQKNSTYQKINQPIWKINIIFICLTKISFKQFVKLFFSKSGFIIRMYNY